MNFITFQQALVEALGWTLIHSLWQGLIIAAILALAIRFTKNKSPQLTYQLCCYSLLGLVVWMVHTFANHFPWVSQPSSIPEGGVANAVNIDGGLRVMHEMGWSHKIDHFFQGFVQSYADELVMVWLLGVVLFGLKWSGSLYYTYSLKNKGVSGVSDQLQAALNHFTQELGIKKQVTILESTHIDVPMVIGWFKPVILLPGSIITGFSSEQIESVIVHELAHIKSNDFMVSLLLSAMEVVLFYHPVYWWISGIIMEEREKRCDDIAVQQCGNPLLYARTLFTIAEHKQQKSLALSLQGKKHQLFDRIKRVCISPQSTSNMQNSKAGMALGLLFMIAIMAIAQVPVEAKEAFIDPVKEAIFETFQPESEASEATDNSMLTNTESVDAATEESLPFSEGESVLEHAINEMVAIADTLPPSQQEGKIIFITRVDREGNTTIVEKNDDGEIGTFYIKNGEGDIYINGKKMQKGNHKMTLPGDTKISFYGTTTILDENEINVADIESLIEGDEEMLEEYQEAVRQSIEENEWEEEEMEEEELEAMELKREAMMQKLEAEHQLLEQKNLEMEALHQQIAQQKQQAIEELKQQYEHRLAAQREEMEKQKEQLHLQHEEMKRQMQEQLKMRKEAMAQQMEAMREQKEQMEEQRMVQMEAAKLEVEQMRIENEKRNELNNQFHTKLSDALYEDGLIKNKEKYKFKLTYDKLMVNKKRQSDALHKKYLELYQSHYHVELHTGSNVEIRKN